MCYEYPWKLTHYQFIALYFHINHPCLVCENWVGALNISPLQLAPCLSFDGGQHWGDTEGEHLFKVLLFSFKLCFVFSSFLALTACSPVFVWRFSGSPTLSFGCTPMELFPVRLRDTSQGRFPGLKVTAHQRVNSRLPGLTVTLHPPESLLTWNPPENLSIIYLIITNETWITL